jgi:hypothetical protein
MRRICLSLPNFFTRVPDSSFILSNTLEPRDGTRAGDSLVSGMRGEGWAMVHLPYGGNVEVDLVAALPGSQQYKAWWIDTRTGGREVFGGGKVIPGSKVFESSTGGTLEDDWLLLLETLSGSRAWFERMV